HEGGKNFGRAGRIFGAFIEGGRAVSEGDVAGDGVVEGRTPVCEAALLGGEVGAFVGNVVNEAIEGVKSGERVALLFREEIEGVVEIAVRGAGDAVAGFVGGGDGARERRCGVRRRNIRSRHRGKAAGAAFAVKRLLKKIGEESAA